MKRFCFIAITLGLSSSLLFGGCTQERAASDKKAVEITKTITGTDIFGSRWVYTATVTHYYHMSEADHAIADYWGELGILSEASSDYLSWDRARISITDTLKSIFGDVIKTESTQFYKVFEGQSGILEESTSQTDWDIFDSSWI